MVRPCVQVSAGGEGGGATYCKVCELLYSGGLYATPEEEKKTLNLLKIRARTELLRNQKKRQILWKTT